MQIQSFKILHLRKKQFLIKPAHALGSVVDEKKSSLGDKRLQKATCWQSIGTRGVEFVVTGLSLYNLAETDLHFGP